MDKLHYTLRPANEWDLPAMHRVRMAAFAPIYASFRSLLEPSTAACVFAHAEEDQGSYLDKVMAPSPNRGVLVALIEDDLVGFCAYAFDRKRKVGTIDLNAVDPAHASCGIGSALYEKAIEIMKQEGMLAAQVSTGGDPSHAPARQAYAKVGLVEPVPSVLLCKTL
ncbi:MAG: GNAT family N-acetyltransferase [Pseudomonadota bacterium]